MDNTEVELKLLIDPADIPRLRRHPLLKALCPSGPKTRKLTSIYFDTDDFVLKNQDIALRVRRSGRQWIQTVKGGGSVQAGLHQRDEWEESVAHSTPDFTKIVDPGLIRLFASDDLRQRLHSVFVTEFNRTVWLLKTEDGDQVEMALDQGEIRSDQSSATICEVELELKVGNPAVLYELALALQEAVPLRPENASKAERGYALCAAPLPRPAVKATLPELAREMTVDAAFRVIAWNCIGQLQDNQSRLLQGYDPELIHQMRVAIRRLRSALNLFGTAAPGIKDATLTAELRWLVGELGPARDWDVFLSETLPPVVEVLPQDAGLARLKQAADRLCQAARERACAAAASPRYHSLLLTLGRWLGREPWRETAEAAELAQLDQPLATFAAAMLGRRHRQLRRRGRNLAQLNAEQRHALRIDAKKLRYAADFFSGLYSRKASRRYLQALADLQDDLGVLNDQAVTGQLLEQIRAGHRDLLRYHAIGVITGWIVCKTVLQLADMAQVWKRFNQCRVFWDEKNNV
ncbi:adenylate cyclase [Sulfuricella sp. T08]|uniref:CYTH and CHAD domain-containing protein n=1 Tax=Sulfuricella sp. T08 TaxID=1632857 RepID=UPI0006179F83|nr:CYTH and CHAD domain-containing protein [Sulfuricella sp. T08]GAO37832.1 adenylate cyclase [Sulfuricella sp. T08]